MSSSMFSIYGWFLRPPVCNIHSKTSFFMWYFFFQRSRLFHKTNFKLRAECSAVVVKSWYLLPWLWLKCSLQLVKLSISTGNKREKEIFDSQPLSSLQKSGQNVNCKCQSSLTEHPFHSLAPTLWPQGNIC